MKLQIEAQVAVHLFERVVDSNENGIHLAVSIRLAVHLEHLPECRIGVRSGAVAELIGHGGNVVIEGYQLHIVLEHIHHFLQIVRVVQREGQQGVVTVELRSSRIGIGNHCRSFGILCPFRKD